jgi:ADP-ribose pyrophosphatase
VSTHSDQGGDDPAGGFAVTDEQEVFSGRVIRLCHLQLTDPDGRPFERDVVRHPGAVAVVAVDDDGVVTLVRQYRPAVGQPILELPAGTCDMAGEPLEQTARRELVEEAGLEAVRVERLVAIYNSPGYSDQVTTIFLATGLRAVPTARDGVEERTMTIETVSLDDVDELITRGDVLDETTVLGLLLARDARRCG